MLWGMDRRPQDIEPEATEAIRAGSTDFGFWLWYAKGPKTKENPWGLYAGSYSYNLIPGTLDAVHRAFSRTEEDWLAFYRDNLVKGDLRFTVTSAKLSSDSLTLTVKNLGKRAEQRIAGPVDLQAAISATVKEK
jgi:hypothetical protein